MVTVEQLSPLLDGNIRCGESRIPFSLVVDDSSSVQSPMRSTSTDLRHREMRESGKSAPMRAYQPMLFTGMGGTGCRIGAELERRLRTELSGSVEVKLRQRAQIAGWLPSCLQFVYADLSGEELDRIGSAGSSGSAVPEISHRLYPAALFSMASYGAVDDTVTAPFADGWSSTSPIGVPGTCSRWPWDMALGQNASFDIGRTGDYATWRHGSVWSLQPPSGTRIGAGQPLDVGRIRLCGAGGGNGTSSSRSLVEFSVAGGTGGGIFADDFQVRDVRSPLGLLQPGSDQDQLPVSADIDAEDGRTRQAAGTGAPRSPAEGDTARVTSAPGEPSRWRRPRPGRQAPTKPRADRDRRPVFCRVRAAEHRVALR